MNELLRPRERRVWMAVVTVLAMAATWFAVLSVALVLPRLAGHAPELMAAGRALLRASWVLFERLAAPALLLLFAAGLGAWVSVARHRGPRAGAEANHA